MTQVITLESLEARQKELAELIESFKKQPLPVFTIPAMQITLAAGELYVGLALNDAGIATHHLILLPGEKESVTWSAAKDWAKSIGGELPTRQEQSLLYANRKKEFKSAWYWSCETYASHESCAWIQYLHQWRPGLRPQEHTLPRPGCPQVSHLTIHQFH